MSMILARLELFLFLNFNLNLNGGAKRVQKGKP